MGRQIIVLSVVVVFLFVNSTVLATNRLVPSQYPTIQAAIDDCNDGDVVIVEPNTYTGDGNLSFRTCLSPTPIGGCGIYPLFSNPYPLSIINRKSSIEN